MPLLAHVDMDSFYVSVERERDPSLIGRPVAVGGGTPRGVIASASYEARAFGVRSAMPTGRARQLCPDLILVSPHGSLYGQRSRAIFAVLETLAPAVEPVSIDEAYLDLTGTGKLYGTPLESAHRIRAAVLEETGLSCSVGVAQVRHVAKMASKMAKPAGALWIPGGSEGLLLAPLSVRALPGVGPSLEKKLVRLGVRTLGELGGRDPAWTQEHLGKLGPALAARARGEGSAALESEDVVKSIGKEITFEKDTRDAGALEAVLLSLCEKVAARLRRGGMWARTVTLKLRDASFESWSRACALQPATQDEGEIYERARALLRAELSGPGKPLRLIGVTCSHLSQDAPAAQGDLFEAPAAPARARREGALAGTLDAVRERFGFDALRRGGSLVAARSAHGEALTGKGALRSELPAGFRGALREGAEKK